jgi:membrane protein
MAPLLVIVIAICGLVIGEEAASAQNVGAIDNMDGRDGAEAIQAMILNARHPAGSLLASLMGVATLIFGAAGLFGQLKDALDTIWEVKPKPGRGILSTILSQFWSVSAVLGTAFLLLVSLLVSAGITAVATYLGSVLPGGAVFWQVANQTIAFGVTTLLFALMFKYLPDVRITWRDVAIGAVLTTVLFTIGKFAIGVYLGMSTFGSTYGAAGSLVVVLFWVYYSTQILFFGAEFTKVYANRYGSRILPDHNALPLTKDAREQQGIPDAGRTATKNDRQTPPGSMPRF